MAITTAVQGAEILNQSLRDLGYGDYTIDLTNGDTIEAGFKAIAALAPEFKNTVLNQVNIILKFRNYGTMFDSSKNPIRRFLRNDINFGGGEEDIYHEIIEPVEGNWAYNFNGEDDDTVAENVAKNLVRFYKYDVKKKFHAKKSPIDIPMSVTEYEIKQIFTPGGFARYIDVKMANMQWSAEVALLNMGIKNVKDMIKNQSVVFKTGFNLNTPNGVTSTVEFLRTATDAMTMISNSFNKSGVNTISNEEDLFLFTTPEFLNRIQTRGYANAFNVEYYRENNQLIVLPYNTDFGEYLGEKVHAILLDRRAIVMSILYWEVKPFIVSNTDYINYFLKCQVLNGYNEFFNGVAICGDVIDMFFDSDDYVIGNVTDNAYQQMSSDQLVINGKSFHYYLNNDNYFMQIPKNSFVEFVNSGGVSFQITSGNYTIKSLDTEVGSFYATDNFIVDI